MAKNSKISLNKTRQKVKNDLNKTKNKTGKIVEDVKRETKDKTNKLKKETEKNANKVKDKAKNKVENSADKIKSKINKAKNRTIKNNKVLFLVFLLFATFFGGCVKNSDTYLNSKYFKSNHSERLPNYQFTELSQTETTSLAKSVLPAVVAIVANTGFSENIGSGVCVKSGGYILTNQHVVDNAKNIKLYFSNNETATAIVLWQDSVMDIAILKSSASIPYLEMSDNDLSEIGHNVLAVGTPLSLNFTHTITKGIISAVNRTIPISTKNGEALMQNLIQHDASINPGNSGGPLIDSNGGVIGINTLKISTAEGLGFAIPINSVQPIVENIFNNYNYKTPYIGVFGYDNSLNLAFEDEDVLGFYVKNVQENSPAKSAGLQEGDVVLAVDDNEVKTTTQFRKNLFKKDAKDKVKLRVRRKNKTFNTFINPKENQNFKPNK